MLLIRSFTLYALKSLQSYKYFNYTLAYINFYANCDVLRPFVRAHTG